MATFFISDIHITDDIDDRNLKLLLRFLESCKKNAESLYILGDLFDIYLGLDRESPVHSKLIQKLKSLSNIGCKIYFMRGNRDFLVNKNDAKKLSAALLPDPHLIQLYNQTIILSHGDILCISDKKYQIFRKIVQNPIVKIIFRFFPFKLKQNIANKIRRKTKEDSQFKFQQNPKLLDIPKIAIDNILNNKNADFIIHGHTHKPKAQAKQYTLGDWNEKNAVVLKMTQDGVKLIDLKNLKPKT